MLPMQKRCTPSAGESCHCGRRLKHPRRGEGGSEPKGRWVVGFGAGEGGGENRGRVLERGMELAE